MNHALRLLFRCSGTVVFALTLSGCTVLGLAPESSNTLQCDTNGAHLKVGFFAFYTPVSYSASDSPDSPGFNTHRGYEAELLTALEEMDNGKWKLDRHAIARWDNIWELATTDDFDVVGGGITATETRTHDNNVAFTNGHIAFRQSLLVRAKDANWLRGTKDLGGSVKVGTQSGTTGEARFLQLAGFADDNGVLIEGIRVVTDHGEVVTDGSNKYFISAGETSPELLTRRRMYPPVAEMPKIIYLDTETSEVALLQALRTGKIDAIARGEISNRDASIIFQDDFAIATLDHEQEYGSFAVDARKPKLLSCLNERLDFLTDNRRIGYTEWRQTPEVFLHRAELWNSQR